MTMVPPPATTATAAELPPAAPIVAVEPSAATPVAVVEPRRAVAEMQLAALDTRTVFAPFTPVAPVEPQLRQAEPSSAETAPLAAPAAPAASEAVAQPAPLPAAAVEPAGPDEIVNTVEVPQTVWIVLPHRRPPPSPAQLLDLKGDHYDKAERCLAQAVYFEARNEPVRGQMAVAQVVMNRVFSPYYPKDVCSVVFQNAHRHLSCQFTFACDGKPEAIRERGAWARAQRIARQTLDAQIWLPEVAKATHYHAAYVRPNWIRDMRVMVRHGLHTFYRPRNWGDGAKEPGWGTAAAAESTVTATPVAHKKRKNS
jgi:hypothetical protein